MSEAWPWPQQHKNDFSQYLHNVLWHAENVISPWPLRAYVLTESGRYDKAETICTHERHKLLILKEL